MRSLKTITIVLSGIALLSLGAWLASRSLRGVKPDALVVYCAHDADYSEPILKEFERRTGIPVVVRFDTEATKTLGLVNLLLQEKSEPRCDVFWCNESLSLLHLKEQGLLEPYRGTGYARIPEIYKDPEGYWTGFAGRLRVNIFNQVRQPETSEQLVEDLWKSEKLGRLVISKPLYGTTLVHYSVLADAWGLEQLKQWHADVHRRGIVEVNGNASVKNIVARGDCDMGWTDSDDFSVAVQAKQPVSMLPIRVHGKTICIPNAVAQIKGSKHPTEAQLLIDFLLSEETELKLSRSTAQQVPLGPVDLKQLSPEVQQLAEWAREGYDLRTLEKSRTGCVKWLTGEYVGYWKQ